MSQRKGGIIQVQVNGVLYDAKGDFDVNLGSPKRSAIIGSSGVHGFKEEPQPASAKGKFTDRGNLDLKTLTTLEDATLTIQAANGKTYVLRNAWYSGDGTVNTGEGEINAEFEATDGEEIAP